MNELPRPPRIVRRRWKSRLGVGVLFILFVVVPQCMTWGGFWMQRTKTELRTRGVETVGWVAERWDATSRKDSPRVRYRYRAGDETHGFWDSVGDSQFAKLAVGQELVVLYLPDAPANGAPADETLSSEWSGDAIALWIISGVLLVIGAPLLLYMRKRERPLEHLARCGVPVPATIVSAVRISSYRGVEVWRVSYQFDLNDERQLGSTTVVPAQVAKTFGEGTPTIVLYDPNDAMRFELLPAIEAVYVLAEGDGAGDLRPGTREFGLGTELSGPGAGDQEQGIDGGGHKLGVSGLVVSCLGIPFCGLTAPVGLALSVVGLLQRRSVAAVCGTVLGAIGVAALLTVGTDAILYPRGTAAPVKLREGVELGYLFPGPDGELGTADDLRRDVANPEELAGAMIDESNDALDAAKPHAKAAVDGVVKLFDAESMAAFPGNRAALTEALRQVESETGQAEEQYRKVQGKLLEAAQLTVDADVRSYYTLQAQSWSEWIEYLRARAAAARLVVDPSIVDAETLESRAVVEFDRAARHVQERDKYSGQAQEVLDAHPDKFKPR